MFRFTLRGLAIYIAFVGLTMALTRVGPVFSMIFTNSILVLSFILAPNRTWQFAWIGGFVGGQLAYHLFDWYISIRFAKPSSQSLRGGRNEFWEHNLPLAFQLGTLIGVTVGLLLMRRRAVK